MSGVTGNFPFTLMPMPHISDGWFQLHFAASWCRKPVVLLHGGTVSSEHNCADFGEIKLLNDKGFQVIGFDFGGHGKCDKPDDSAAYGADNRAIDVVALLGHLELKRSLLMAHYIGAAVALVSASTPLALRLAATLRSRLSTLKFHCCPTGS